MKPIDRYYVMEFRDVHISFLYIHGPESRAVTSLKASSCGRRNCPSEHVVVARLHRQTARRCERVHRSGAQSKAQSPSDAAHNRTYLAAASVIPEQCSRNSWRKYLSLSSFLFHTLSFIHPFISLSLARSLSFFAWKCFPISPFENAWWNGAISKVADTGRAEGSTASVAWPDRRAALPRDTLLKQRATLKFSEDPRRSRSSPSPSHCSFSCSVEMECNLANYFL